MHIQRHTCVERDKYIRSHDDPYGHITDIYSYMYINVCRESERVREESERVREERVREFVKRECNT